MPADTAELLLAANDANAIPPPVAVVFSPDVFPVLRELREAEARVRIPSDHDYPRLDGRHG